MFAVIRIAYICLVAFCCSSASANTHQIRATDTNLASSHRSRDLARSPPASPTLAILPHGALPATEPFALSTNVPTGEMSTKWSELQSRISADENLLEACRLGESTCSEAERRFLSIVELARKHEGRARLGWLNRAVNMSIKPTSDWLQYGNADYWASPLQTLGSGAGDCEDYAIVKYVALRAVGVDVNNLRLVIVQGDKRPMEHAVLAVRYEQQWLILDNLTMAIVAAEEARSYRPLFALNSSRAVAVADPAQAPKIE
jgi:predicted transglutaminase-like cysteine proteinase